MPNKPRSCFFVLIASVLFSLPAQAADQADEGSANYSGITEALTSLTEVPLEPEIQRERAAAICEKYEGGEHPVTGELIASEVSGLTNKNRVRAIGCLFPPQSIVIKAETFARLGIGLSDVQRYSLFCRYEKALPVPQTSQAIAGLLGDLVGKQRARATRCLAAKLEEGSVSTPEALRMLGPFLPEQFAGWDGTLSDYQEGPHTTALCAIAKYLMPGLGPDQVALLLGQSRDYKRKEGLRCVVESIAHDLSWSDVATIVGPSLKFRGTMIGILGERAPDGRNARKLDEFRGRFHKSKTKNPSARYLNDRDPPAWLDGQCIAFARLSYKEVTDSTLDMQFGAARNIIEKSSEAGLPIETDPSRATVGALIVWDEGVYGHVGIVVDVQRDRHTGLVSWVQVSESNWGIATKKVTDLWGISIEEAKKEIVTDRYGFFDTRSFSTAEIDRPPPAANEPLSYKFIGYVLPEESSASIFQ